MQKDLLDKKADLTHIPGAEPSARIDAWWWLVVGVVALIIVMVVTLRQILICVF